MSETAEGPLELVVGGFMLTVLGSALAPLLPFNMAIIGQLMMVGGVVAAVVGVVATISEAVGSV